MALEWMNEGESPAEVAASFGLRRGWAYKVPRSRGEGEASAACSCARAQAGLAG